MTTAISDSGVQFADGSIMESASKLGLRNRIINGSFDVWQRGTSQVITGIVYVADRWVSGSGTGGVATIYRSSHAMGDYPSYYLTHNQTTGGTFPFDSQRIESVRTFNSKTVTFSISATSTINTTVTVIARQFFGTGGSPSSVVDTTLGTLSVTAAVQRLSVTGTVPSVAGKTLGSNGDDYLEIILKYPDSTVFSINLWQAQLEVGSVATPFEQRPYGMELALCRRYGRPSPSGVLGQAFGATTSGHSLYLDVPLRGSPTLSTTAGFTVSTAGGGTVSATPVISALNDNLLYITTSGASSLTAGNATILNAPAGAFLSSEL